MRRCAIALSILAIIGMSNPVTAYTLSGEITGGQTGFTLKYVFAVPVTLDTVYLTIAIPILNTYIFLNIDSGSYVLFAYQDLNTNVVPDLDEPRGFYGGDIPQIFQLLADSSGVDIELHPPNQGGFTGSISYEGALTGTTLLYAHYTPDFEGLPHGGSLLFNNTGNGDYIALVDSFTTYYAYAFMDLNNNFAWDVGEPRGVYGGATPAPIVVEQSDSPEGINIIMEETSWSSNTNSMIVKTFTLDPIYPNPFNSTATVTFTLATSSEIELTVFDVLGRRVVTLARGTLSIGEHRVSLDTGNLSSGLYYVRLSGSQRYLSQPVLLIR